MSGTDQIVLNTRERASSDDMNNLQALKDRTLLDSWLEQFQRRTYSVGAQPVEVSQPIVLGGLEVAPSGLDIGVSPGVLLQDSTTLVPVPGALDSDYRWSALRAAAVIANPAPGGDTWFLIEAQMSEVVAATATRDIFDTATGLFVPTLVDKRTERTIVLSLVTGTATDIPLPTGGDFVVIGAVLVPTGGGAIPAANFFDMRPLWDDLGPANRPAASQGRRQTEIETANDPTVAKDIRIAAEAWVEGRRLWFETDENGVNLVSNLATFRDGITNPQVINTLSFLYIAPLDHTALPAGADAMFIRNPYAQGGLPQMNGNTILIWSTTPPSADKMLNGTALDAPPPFDSYTIPVGRAVCIGALHTDSSGIILPTGSGGVNKQELNSTVTSSFLEDTIVPTGAGTGDAISIANVPILLAKTIDILVEWTRNGAGSLAGTWFVQPTGGNALNRWWNLIGDFDTSNPGVRLTIPARTAFELGFSGTAPVSATVTLVGWSV